MRSSRSLLGATVLLPFVALLGEPDDIRGPTTDEMQRLRTQYANVVQVFRRMKPGAEFSAEFEWRDVVVMRPNGGRLEQLMVSKLTPISGCIMIVDSGTHTLRSVQDAGLGDRLHSRFQAMTAEERAKGLPRKQFQYRYYPQKLTPAEAVARAREYLAAFGFPIPKGFELHQADFGTRTLGMWNIAWHPIIGGHELDKFNESWVPEVVVAFDETEGLISAGWADMPPTPANLTVKVTREEAMLKASRVAPLVFETPYYKRTRVGGFVVASIFECNLRIAAPNYLLDPARAVWGRRSPPKETRLCWVVRLRTKPGSRELEEQALMPPDIVIYIDALTGETVGANFS
jgi:hypothetical protein